MGDVVDLHNNRSIPLEDDELVENLARFSDGTLSEAAIKARHHLSEEEWAALGEDDELIEKIEARKLFRVRSGLTKRERAQIEIVDGPPNLGGIMRDVAASPRHRVDAIKALDSLATGGGSESTPASDRFVITINLGSDVLHFDKSIAINANDPDDSSIMPQDMIAAFVTNKKGWWRWRRTSLND